MFHFLASEAVAFAVAVAFCLLCLAGYFFQWRWLVDMSLFDAGSLAVGCVLALRFVAGGHAVRWPHEKEMYRSRVALVTGATSGVGFGVARGLAEHGFTVFVTGRDKAQLRETVDTIKGYSPDADVRDDWGTMDLRDFDSVRSFAACVKDSQETYPLAVLVNAAGCLRRHLHRGVSAGQKKSQAEEGDTVEVEEMLAANALGPMLLTELLLPVLERTATNTHVSSRIVNVASSCHTFLGFGKRRCQRPMDMILELHGELPDGTKASNDPPQDFTFSNFVGYYGLSKLCVVWYTSILARRVSSMVFPSGTSDTGTNNGGELKIHVSCCHPGVLTTHLYRDLFPKWALDTIIYYPSLLVGKTWSEGAYAPLRCCVQETRMVQGGYYMCSGEYGAESGVNCVSAYGRDLHQAQQFCLWARKHIGV